MNAHQRRTVVRAIARDEWFPLFDLHRSRRLFVSWDLFPAQQTFGKHFDKYVTKAKAIREAA